MDGLTSAKALDLLKVHGPNAIEEQKKKSFITVLIDQFNNFLTILLVVSALLSFFIGEPVDGGLILAIVILNALFGIYQEAKASEAIAALKHMTTTKVRVVRDGQEQEIDSRDLVPGDMVFIEEGVKVPADGKVQKGINLEINESALTGESLAVSKQDGDVISMGTIVTRGRGHCEITETGMRTKFGLIADELTNIEETKSPLQIKIEKVTKTIGIIGIVASLCVFFLATAQGSAYFAAFLLAISLAVAVVPEGLPAVMTITLSIGVKEMARKRTIVRKLTAIEALGSVTVIASDKTGTLTTNKMKVKELFVDGHRHDQIGSLTPSNHSFELLLNNSILCSTATLSKKDDEYDVVGDPTEGALLFMAQEIRYDFIKVRDDWTLVEEIPFDSVTKQMTVVVSQGDQTITFSKGAPESILAHTDKIYIDGHEVAFDTGLREKTLEILNGWTKQGLRVLAFSYEKGHATKSKTKTFLGMTAIFDAPRPEAKEAVSRAHSAGIQVIMITGDNEQTAEAIARTAGILSDGHRILTGNQLDAMSEADLMQILPEVRVFARTTPFHKHFIVSLLQKRGEIVAVTGDGVNDAIALKQADVGIAMGRVGTDVARETADMVITDDNFATIVDAIEEGRNIIKNLRNAIVYLLSCNVTEAIALIVGMLLGFPHIFSPIQFLYINLVTDGIPALALAFSPRDPHLMKIKPDKELNLLNTPDLWYIGSIGIVGTILVLGTYAWFNAIDGQMGSVSAFCVLALIQSFIFVNIWLSRRSILGNITKLYSPLFAIAFILPFITQYLIVRVPLLANVFSIPTVSTYQYGLYVALSFSVLVFLAVTRTITGAFLLQSRKEK